MKNNNHEAGIVPSEAIRAALADKVKEYYDMYQKGLVNELDFKNNEAFKADVMQDIYNTLVEKGVDVEQEAAQLEASRPGSND